MVVDNAEVELFLGLFRCTYGALQQLVALPAPGGPCGEGGGALQLPLAPRAGFLTRETAPEALTLQEVVFRECMWWQLCVAKLALQ